MDIHDVLNDNNTVRQLGNIAKIQLQPISSDPFTAIRRDYPLMVQQFILRLSEYLAINPFQNAVHTPLNDKSLAKQRGVSFGLKQELRPFYQVLGDPYRHWHAVVDTHELGILSRELPGYNCRDLLFYNAIYGSANTLEELVTLAKTTTPLDICIDIERHKRQEAIFYYLEGAGRHLWGLHNHDALTWSKFKQCTREFVIACIPLTHHNIATLIAKVFFAKYNLNTVIRLWYSDLPITGQELKPYL